SRGRRPGAVAVWEAAVTPHPDTIHRLHAEHCPRGERCPHGRLDPGFRPGGPRFICPMYAAITAGYRAAVEDAAGAVQELQDRSRPATTDLQRGALFGCADAMRAIRQLAPKDRP